jgi:hypothetical protein
MKTFTLVSHAARLALFAAALLQGACAVDAADEAQTEDSATETDALSSSKRLDDVYITWYGFNDNSCEVESQHTCSNIAYPKSDGYPTKHDAAKEGKGTYDDPITFATGARDDGSHAVFKPGTRIYVPSVRKYFIMEDQCYECGKDWDKRGVRHVDLWMGPQHKSNDGKLSHCQEKLTIGSVKHPTGVIIVKPAKDLPVDTHPLFTHDTCTAHEYPNK